MGGTMKPASSECVMMRPPMRRVDTPQDVCHTWCCLPSRPWKVMSNALAKFCPRLWLVPACSAFLSCIIASML